MKMHCFLTISFNSEMEAFHYVRYFSWKHFFQYHTQFRSKSSAMFGQQFWSARICVLYFPALLNCLFIVLILIRRNECPEKGQEFTNPLSIEWYHVPVLVPQLLPFCWTRSIYHEFFRTHVTKSCENFVKQSSF